MKNYKYLIPILLVVLMGAGIYSTLSTAGNEKNEYVSYIKEARKMAELDVVDDALADYRKALDIRDTIDISLEVGQLYVDHEWISESISWGEYLVEHFPKEPKAYTFLLQRYMDTKQYDDCFKLQNQAQARDAQNQEFSDLMQSIQYIYELGYDEYDDVGTFSGGYCAVEDEGLWGYVGVTGNTKIKTQFQWAGVFSPDGVAPVQDTEGNYYYIADTGNKKIALQNLQKCTALGASIGGILPAAEDGVFNYYDHEFNIAIKDDTGFDYATPMNGGIAAVNKNNVWFLMDSQGKRLTKEDYDGFILDERGIAYLNDRAFARKGDQIVMINSSGKEIGNQAYEDAELFFQENSYTAVKSGGKWGFIDADGKTIIEPQYEEARSFSNGYAAVKENGKWGFIDTNGQLVIECQFDGAKEFNFHGCVFVQTNGKWQLLALKKDNYS